ncbi:MAG TPA: 2OG-Fe(II) oxygenase [Xanthobacteraceae bacterium]
MSAYSYRQPVVGQAFVDLIEGQHPRGLALDAFAGRYLVICCYGSSQIKPGRAALDAMCEHADLFDGVRRSFLAVTIDPNEKVKAPPNKGLNFVVDRDGVFSRHCGAAPVDGTPLGSQHRVTWTVVDPSLRVVAHFHTGADRGECEAVFALLLDLPDADAAETCEIPAPILVLPRLFEPDFCDRLVALYENGYARDSGFMRNNVEIFDYSFKRRRDYFIDDEAIKDTIVQRISCCVTPEIRRLFFMKITRMERYLIGCYAAEEEAHFRPHRDNGQAITAHRRFALSVALNDDFDGGELLFPEYNQRPHRIAKGWCIVFPCALLHSVTRVTRGRRYVFLPFLYDEAGAEIKAQWQKQPEQALGQ